MRVIKPLAGAIERINALNATIRRHPLSGLVDVTAKSVMEYDALVQNCPPLHQTTSEPTLRLPNLDLPDASDEEEYTYDTDDNGENSSVDGYSDVYESMASPSPLHETLVDVGPTEETHTSDPPEDSELAVSAVNSHVEDVLDEPEGTADLERSYPDEGGPEGSSGTQGDEYESEMVSETPPSMLVEPEVPDPFIVDDGEDDSDSNSGAGNEDSSSDEGGGTPAAADEIALAQSIIIEPPQQPVNESSIVSNASREPPSALSLDVNKNVPPTPSTPQTISDDDEEEPPELYLPGLILPTMFLPIPNVRSRCPSRCGFLVCLTCCVRRQTR